MWGDVTVKSVHDIGPFGSPEPVRTEVPLRVECPWLRLAGVWAVVLLLLRKVNRRWSAWWIWAPVLGALAVQCLLRRWSVVWDFSWIWQELYQEPRLMVYALVLSALLLMQPVRFRGAGRLKKVYAIGRALVFAVGFGMIAMMFEHLPVVAGLDAAFCARLVVTDWGPMVLGVIFAGVLSRRTVRPVRFCAWYLVYACVATPVLVTWTKTGGHPMETVMFYLGMHGVTLMFLVMVFSVRFYRERLGTAFGAGSDASS